MKFQKTDPNSTHFWQWYGKPICYCYRRGKRMRFIKSFMLHFYVDSDDPERQCGDLQAVSDRKSQLFKSQSELISLLQRIHSPVF